MSMVPHLPAAICNQRDKPDAAHSQSCRAARIPGGSVTSSRSCGNRRILPISVRVRSTYTPPRGSTGAGTRDPAPVVIFQPEVRGERLTSGGARDRQRAAFPTNFYKRKVDIPKKIDIPRWLISPCPSLKMIFLLLASCLAWISGISWGFVTFTGAPVLTGWSLAGTLIAGLAVGVRIVGREMEEAPEYDELENSWVGRYLFELEQGGSRSQRMARPSHPPVAPSLAAGRSGRRGARRKSQRSVAKASQQKAIPS